LNIIPVEWVDEIVSLALEKEPLPLKKSNKSKKQKTLKSSTEKNQEKQTH
jgi:predicted ATP-dependent protease